MKYSNRRQGIVEFIQTLVPESSSDLKLRDIMYVRTLWNSEEGSDLFLDYESPYHFESSPELGEFLTQKNNNK